MKKSFLKFFYKVFYYQYVRLKPLNFESEIVHRKEIIQKLIDHNNYTSYLEIGCFQDEVFSYIDCKKKIGVDPIQGGNTRLTSDVFFKNNKDKFDCIFIDGLHTYDQCKKDVFNSLRFLNKDGIILIHDCLPTSFLEQTDIRLTSNWYGTVWKSMVELRTMDNIETYTINCDSGIGVVQKKKGTNRLILDKKINKITFKDFYYNYKNWLRLISYDEFKKNF